MTMPWILAAGDTREICDRLRFDAFLGLLGTFEGFLRFEPSFTRITADITSGSWSNTGNRLEKVKNFVSSFFEHSVSSYRSFFAGAVFCFPFVP